MHEAMKRTFAVYSQPDERDSYGARTGAPVYVKDIAAVLTFDGIYNGGELAVRTEVGRFKAVTDAAGLERGMILEGGGRRYRIEYVNDMPEQTILHLVGQYEWRTN